MWQHQRGGGGKLFVTPCSFNVYPPPKKAGKKRWNGFLKHLPCAASTDQHTHTHTHTWRKALIEILTRRTPHTLTKTPLLSHTSTPLKTVQNWAHRWRILISFVLIRWVSVFFFASKGFCLWLQHGHEPRPQKPPPHCGDCWPKLLPYKWVNYDSDLWQAGSLAGWQTTQDRKVFREFSAFH